MHVIPSWLSEIYVGGYLIPPGLEPRSLAEQFARVRKAGAVTLLDVVCAGPGEHLRALEPILPHTDAFLPNQDEALLILGETDAVRQARAFAELGASRVVITDGENGAVAWPNQLRTRLGGYPVTFVDGTGGGDAFDAGYIAGLLEGLDEINCLKLASAVGASYVRAVGVTAGVFTRAESAAFIAEHELAVGYLTP